MVALHLTYATAVAGAPRFEVTAIFHDPRCPPIGEPETLTIFDINNAGQIVASGRISKGRIARVILTLIDPPFNPAILNRDGCAETLNLDMLLSTRTL